ncbi:hypothetical protein [Coleofasciculus sp. G2-EDA-02]
MDWLKLTQPYGLDKCDRETLANVRLPWIVRFIFTNLLMPL